MPYQNLTAISTKATAWNTSSSGATVTVPALVGKTAFLSAIRLLFGPAISDSTIPFTLAGVLASPFTVITGGIPNFQEFDFESSASGPVFATGVNTAIVATLAPVVGGGDVTLVVYYGYS